MDLNLYMHINVILKKSVYLPPMVNNMVVEESNKLKIDAIF